MKGNLSPGFTLANSVLLESGSCRTLRKLVGVERISTYGFGTAEVLACLGKGVIVAPLMVGVGTAALGEAVGSMVGVGTGIIDWVASWALITRRWPALTEALTILSWYPGLLKVKVWGPTVMESVFRGVKPEGTPSIVTDTISGLEIILTSEESFLVSCSKERV